MPKELIEGMANVRQIVHELEGAVIGAAERDLLFCLL